MTNLEKWKKKLAEAKDSFELLEAVNKMNEAHTRWCWESYPKPCEYESCGECKARWMDMEAEE